MAACGAGWECVAGEVAVTEWRKIPGMPEVYEASSDGQIRVLPHSRRGEFRENRIEGRVLTPRLGGDKSNGHPVVHLHVETRVGPRSRAYRVARLVAGAFLGWPYDPQREREGAKQWRLINLDGDVLNCRADNLRWISNQGKALTGETLYERNLRTLAERRDEPVEVFIRRLWGEEVVV